MKKRTIPFGYTIRNGKIQVEVGEAKTVKQVFDDYLNGKSFRIIADYLTDEKIIYHEDKVKWDKLMIKRLLECNYYCGDAKYPQIVDKKTFEAVAKLIAAKYNKCEKDPCISLLKKRTFCQECGERMYRENFNPRYRRWICKRCGKPVMMEEILIRKTLSIINTIIRTPDLLDEIETRDTYESEFAITAKNSELTRMISLPGVNFQNAFENILELASMKYDNCEAEIAEELTDTIKRDFIGRDALDRLDSNLLERTVSHITVDETYKVAIHFINGAVIRSKEEGTHGNTQNRSKKIE